MRYDRVTGGVFLSRLSRFSARAIVGGCEQTVHVKNTGRLRELLIPGAEAVLCPSDSPGRKTAYDLVAVRACIPGARCGAKRFSALRASTCILSGGTCVCLRRSRALLLSGTARPFSRTRPPSAGESTCWSWRRRGARVTPLRCCFLCRGTTPFVFPRTGKPTPPLPTRSRRRPPPVWRFCALTVRSRPTP